MLSWAPKSAACVISSPTAVMPFSYLPTGFPLRKKCPACLIPSNSRKTFWPSAEAGMLKCFRYQPMPSIFSLWSPPLWLMYALYVSVSFHVCGRLTLAQAESSKAGWSAPAASPNANFQPGLKLYVARGEAGASNFAPTDAAPASACAAGWSAVEQAVEKTSSAPRADETRTRVFKGKMAAIRGFRESFGGPVQVTAQKDHRLDGRGKNWLSDTCEATKISRRKRPSGPGISPRARPRRASPPRTPKLP